jgi:hypothetical protein
VRRFGTLLSFALAAAAITAGAIGCNGPISDWPPKAGDDTASGGGINPNKPVITADAAVGPATPGGATGSNSGGTAGGTTGGASAPGILGGLTGGTFDSGLTPGGGFLGGSDAGSVRPPLDSGGPPTSADAGTSPESGTDTDAGVPDADTGVGDAGDGGSAGEGGCNIVPTDAGHVPGDDAGLCAAYGCGVTLDSLSKLVTTNGACTTTEALPFVCSGALSRAALQCTQDNVLMLSLGRAVSACMRRLPQLSKVPVPCQQCYVDETLCTLSRCFAACIDGRDPACQQCRLQACGSAFTTCSGVPTPAQTMF